MSRSKACPKCSGAMSEGFDVDKSCGTAEVAQWVGGPPQKTFWMGLKLGGQEKIEIVTWRCRDGGYPENYAE